MTGTGHPTALQYNSRMSPRLTITVSVDDISIRDDTLYDEADTKTKQEAQQSVGPGKRGITKIRPKAIGGGIFSRFQTYINANWK